MIVLRLISLFFIFLGGSLYASDPTVGMEGQFTVDVSGSEIVVNDEVSQDQLIVYIAERQTSSEGWKYDIRYIGQFSGSYDLKDYVSRKNGGSNADIPRMPVKVVSLLPKDHNGWVIPTKQKPYRFFEYYHIVLGVVIFLWLFCLIPLFLWGRKKKVVEEVEEETPSTDVDIFQNLLIAAGNGTLDPAGKAQLEKILYSLLRSELHLKDASPSKMIRAIKADKEAGAFVKALEKWLHYPVSEISLDEVNEMLALYRENLNEEKI